MDADFDDIVFYAFRYALGRKTYATYLVSKYLQLHWDELKEHTRELIQKDIREAIESGNAGMKMDEKEWGKLLGKKYE